MVEGRYELEVSYQGIDGRNDYRFLSADGLHVKKSLRRCETLILDSVDVREASDVAVSHANYGFLPVLLADRMRSGDVDAVERSVRACELIRENAHRNDVDGVNVHLAKRVPRTGYDAAVFAPRPYQSVAYVKDIICRLVASVQPGGYAFIAAGSSSGLNRYKSFLEGLPGDVLEAGSDGDQTVLAYSVDGDEDVGSFSLSHQFASTVRDKTASFEAEDGLFSKSGLDRGSRFLLEAVSVTEGEEVLDACCGYGAIGVFLGLQGASVTMCDDDVVATAYADRNADQNGVHAEISTTDCLDGFERDSFDCVVTNPPTHAGSGVTRKLFSQAAAVLRENGRFFAVYNESLQYGELAEEFFDTVSLVDSKDGYAVLKACP